MSESSSRPQRTKRPPSDFYSGIDPTVLSDDDFEVQYSKTSKSSKSSKPNSDTSARNTQSPLKKDELAIEDSSDFEIEEVAPKPTPVKKEAKRVQSESEDDYSLSDDGLSDAEEDEESDFESDNSFSGKKSTKKAAAPKKAPAKKAPATKIAKTAKPAPKSVKASTPTTTVSKPLPRAVPKAAVKPPSIPSLLKSSASTSSASKGTAPSTLKKIPNSNVQIPNGIHFYPDKTGKPKAGL
ncbi:hypothetical protein CONCODRAFT_76809, partial [Conidiobolus coronatus NRRL 28638]